jgi:ArsR family transcriptional regulator
VSHDLASSDGIEQRRPPRRRALSPQVAPADAAVRGFKALGDPGRFQILRIISAAGAEGVCVGEIVSQIGLSQPTVSHHLGVLYDAGLVDRQRQGTWAYYQLNRAALIDLLTRLPI